MTPQGPTSGRVVRIVTRLNQGGPARQLSALVPALAQVGWTGPVLHGTCEPHEPDVSADLAEQGLDLSFVPGLRRGLAPWRDARLVRFLAARLRGLAPDVVHTHMGKGGALGRMAAARAGIPVVHTLHGHHFDRPGWRGRLAVRVERRLGRRTDALICLAPSQAKDVARHRILPSDRVHVIPPTLPLHAFHPSADVVPTLPPRLLWMGRFVPVKATSRLLGLMEALPDDIGLDLLGDGPGRAAFEADIVARGLSERIRVHGAVPDVRPWLARAAVVVLVSQQEGTPLALLEARAAGVPVVADGVGGIPDLLAGVPDAWVVPPGDDAAWLASVRTALDAAPARRPCAIVGARHAPEIVAAQTARLYGVLAAAAATIPA